MFISCVYVTADDEIRPQAVYNLGVRFAYMTVALCRKREGFLWNYVHAEPAGGCSTSLRE